MLFITTIRYWINKLPGTSTEMNTNYSIYSTKNNEYQKKMLYYEHNTFRELKSH